MPLSEGTRLGPYEIFAALGAGGMGEVYRARDTKLDRDVAIKVMAGSLAQDPAALARFQREAKVIAALSHPNILAIYDLGIAPGGSGDTIQYAVMELLEGETLRQKLTAGSVPPRKAMHYVLQAVRGLAAAHGKGIGHRDLKPENLFVTPDGHLKILDFGLAHLTHATTPSVTSGSPTVTLETTPGVIVGTVAYMSPEQVRGQAVDGESDLFSLGIVLYELLAGRRPFGGDSTADTLGAILRDDPPDLPQTTPPIPPALDRIVRRCLEKNPAERFHSAGDLAFTLETIGGLSTSSGAVVPTGARVPERWARQTIWLAVSAALGLVAGLTPLVIARLHTPAASPLHVSIVLPGSDVLGQVGPTDPPKAIAISPDGETIVYQIRGANAALVRRSLGDGRATSIPGTNGATSALFSADGQWLMFSRVPLLGAAGTNGGTKLWKIPIGGGSAQPLCDAAYLTGASWGDDGTIVYAPNFDTGLWRVSARGGPCEPLTTLGKDEASHVWPDILPGAKAVIYTAEVAGQSFDNARIMIRPLPSGDPRVLFTGGSGAMYARSGHLLFGRANRLMAVPFDLKRLAVTGSAVPVLEGVSDAPAGGTVRFVLSDRGTLAYVPGGGPRAERSLAWVDRDGSAHRFTDAGRNFNGARLSPDGAQIALDIADANDDVWVYDVDRGSSSRRTSEGENFLPEWTPDGQRLFFTSNRSGGFNLFWTAADGSGPVEQLTHLSSSLVDFLPGSMSPDGKTIAFTRLDPGTGDDIWTLRLDGDRTPHPLLRTPFNESLPRIAPDGRRIAFQSDESERFEVYVAPFPGPGAKRQVSVNGGGRPMWSRDGRELFFIQGDTLMVARVEPGESVAVGKPQALFTGMSKFAGYDPAPDGRLLMIQRSEEELSSREIHIIVNFLEELKRVQPAK